MLFEEIFCFCCLLLWQQDKNYVNSKCGPDDSILLNTSHRLGTIDCATTTNNTTSCCHLLYWELIWFGLLVFVVIVIVIVCGHMPVCDLCCCCPSVLSGNDAGTKEKFHRRTRVRGQEAHIVVFLFPKHSNFLLNVSKTLQIYLQLQYFQNTPNFSEWLASNSNKLVMFRGRAGPLFYLTLCSN